MATTTTRKKTAANPPATEAAREVPFSETPNPEVKEETTNLTDADQEAATEYNAELADFDDIPPTDSPLANAAMEKLVNLMHEAERHNRDVLNNSSTPEGIKNLADTVTEESENWDDDVLPLVLDVVDKRETRDELTERIAGLQNELNRLQQERTDADGVLTSAATVLMDKRIDASKRVGAKSLLQKSQNSFNRWMAALKDEVDAQEEPFKTWIKEVQERTLGSHTSPVRPASSPSPQSAEKRARSARIRKWAATQGIEVNERGRIAQDVVDKYEAAHPEDVLSDSE